MTDVKILSAGPATSIQDLGRNGYLNLGVCQTGAADTRLLKLANALVGNDEDAACLEFSLLGPSLQVQGASRLVSVVGDVVVKLNGQVVDSFQSLLCQAGDTLSIGAIKSHTYAYIAFSGGIETPLLYGSRATHARAGMGGLDGRMLVDGDVLPLGASAADQALRLPSKQAEVLLAMPKEIEVVLGPQDDAFTPAQIQLFLNSDYTVGRETDRMGMRLEGQALKHIEGADILSDGIAPGSIQVPGSGLPIVLLAERQTIGGYTKIATVVSSSLGILSQALPRTVLRFKALSPSQAISLTRARHAEFQTMLKSLKPVVRAPNLADLMGANLVSGVVDANVESKP